MAAPAAPGSRAPLPAAAALSAALALLPFVLLVPLDDDRLAPLAFLPAVWLGWKISRPAPFALRLLFGWAVAAMILAAALSDHPARAFAVSAAVLWTLSGAFVARNLAGDLRSVRLVLAGLVAGPVAGLLMLRLGVDSAADTFPVYGSTRLFGAHQFVGCAASAALLVCPPPAKALRALIAAGGLLCWTGLFWSGSRAPVLAFAVLSLLWLWRAANPERLAFIRWLPALATLGLIASLALGRPYDGMGWSAALTRTVQATSVEAVSSGRSHFWAETWRHALRSPLVGHGADGYRFMAPAQDGSQPHNMLLQWLLEYGVLGLVPLSALLACALLPPRPSSSASAPLTPLHLWAGAASAGLAVYGLFEGVFYHATIFMPAAVVVGLALGARFPPVTPAAEAPARLHPLRPLLHCALGVLLLHSWLCFMFLRAPRFSPDAPPARILRVFPSTTDGLSRWIDRWRRDRPGEAMEWIVWAQNVSVESASFHLFAAQLLIWEKNYESAEAELLHCLEKVHRIERADVRAAIDMVRSLQIRQTPDTSAHSP